MFCPFIKKDCVSDCIFKNSDHSCDFLKAIKNIESNTGSDQTDSYWINSKLSDVSDKLDNIIKYLEQSAD